jgi:myosin III
MIETLRCSEENIIRICFTNPLSKSGNLTMEMASSAEGQPKQAKKSAWKNALMSEKAPLRRMNSLSRGQYSQIHKMRTLSSIFRATSLEILKSLSIVSNSSGVHFVRCMRSDLDYREFGFNEDVVRQQMRALAILDTARARQKGFSVRIPFNEFLRRYKFLAFDFDENVEVTKDNCRLLLVRLKMEGWLIGNSKVFLKYYNEEFLARLYETQVKKIIKVQSMMRAFLAKRNVESKTKPTYGRISKQPSSVNINKPKEFSNEEAVIKIQTAFRGYQIRKIYGPLIDAKTGKIDMATAKFIEPYAIRWKRKSIFQILLQYRSIRHLDLVNFAQVENLNLLKIYKNNDFPIFSANSHLQSKNGSWNDGNKSLHSFK